MNPSKIGLPSTESGYLPLWLFLVGTVATLNSIQAFTSATYIRRIYNGPQASSSVTPLAARTYAAWTFLAGVLRVYSAYRVNEYALYDASLWSFGIAWVHFVSEWLVFGTVKLEVGSAAAMTTASVSVLWMVAKRAVYLG